MNNSKQLFTEKSSKRYSSTDKNLPYNHKRICDLPADHIRTCSYTKMIIESYERLNKSQAIELLQQASSTESKLSLLDAMKDKVTLSTEEIDELVPATDSSSLDTTELSSFDSLSYLSLLGPQQPSHHVLNSFNNAALSSKMSSKTNRRTAILRSLFGRTSSKRRAPMIRQPVRNSQREGKQRMISGGDQVKFSSTKLVHADEPYQDEKYPQGDTVHSLKTIHTDLQSAFQGLRYDFKKTSDAVSVNPPAIKQTFKENPLPMPFSGPSSFGQDECLLSLSDLASMRQPTKELKHTIQSAHSVGGVPNGKPSNNTHEKTLFNAHQHKYHPQTPNYYYPRPLSTIELQSKQYPSFGSSRNSAGLCWYSANQSTARRATKLSTHGSASHETKRFDSSSDSRDTSSSSSASSSNSSSRKTAKADTSSSASSTSSASSSGSSSTSTASSFQIENQPFAVKGQHNRNQNDKDDLIRIDLHSITSQTSISASTTSDHSDRSTSSISTSSFNINTNKNGDTVKNAGKRIDPLTIDLFSSANNRTVDNFKVKRQRIESNRMI